MYGCSRQVLGMLCSFYLFKNEENCLLARVNAPDGGRQRA